MAHREFSLTELTALRAVEGQLAQALQHRARVYEELGLDPRKAYHLQ